MPDRINGQRVHVMIWKATSQRTRGDLGLDEIRWRGGNTCTIAGQIDHSLYAVHGQVSRLRDLYLCTVWCVKDAMIIYPREPDPRG